MVHIGAARLMKSPQGLWSIIDNPACALGCKRIVYMPDSTRKGVVPLVGCDRVEIRKGEGAQHAKASGWISETVQISRKFRRQITIGERHARCSPGKDLTLELTASKHRQWS